MVKTAAIRKIALMVLNTGAKPMSREKGLTILAFEVMAEGPLMKAVKPARCRAEEAARRAVTA